MMKVFRNGHMETLSADEEAQIKKAEQEYINSDDYKKIQEELAKHPIPKTDREMLEELTKDSKTMKKALADLGNLVGKLMRGGGV